MKPATASQPLSDLQIFIKNSFADFNRLSSPSRSRKYPSELKTLVYRGGAAGLSNSELQRLTGMSSTAITNALLKPKPPAARRLEVVSQTIAPQAKTIPLVIRLPSGISIELAHQEMLTASLLATLRSMGATHAASR